jgi:hypothetical protein
MSNQPITILANQKSFKVWTNPSFPELSAISPLVRFTADNRRRNVYIWDFNSGHHGDVSIGLKLDDPYWVIKIQFDLIIHSLLFFG